MRQALVAAAWLVAIQKSADPQGPTQKIQKTLGSQGTSFIFMKSTVIKACKDTSLSKVIKVLYRLQILHKCPLEMAAILSL